MTAPLDATPGAKMMYLIRRRPATSREELIAHWFANHMPGVIRQQGAAAERGRLHARRYIATLFRPDAHGAEPWDGVAQLWWDRPLPRPDEPYGLKPADTFQEKAEPYEPWPTVEYVVMDGSERLAVEPNTLNEPFPCTRSGFFKVTFLVPALAETNFDEFFSHWLTVHLQNVRGWMSAAGGFRYVISHSLEPESEPYAGMAELYFADEEGWAAYRRLSRPDGMERWVDTGRMAVLPSVTEMVGIA